MPYGPAVVPDPAISTPATAAALPGPRWWAWALAGWGLLCLLGWGIAHTVVAAAGGELRAGGVSTEGVVSEVVEHGRLRPDTATVSYRAGGRLVEGVVEPGLTGADYEAGQTVVVFYDAGDPARMTIDDVDPASGWGWVISLAGAGGLIWSAVGVIGVAQDRLGRRRLVRVLSGGPWRPVHVQVRLEDAVQPDLLVTTPDGGVWRAGDRWRGQDLRLWTAPTSEFREGYGWSRPRSYDRDAWWVVDGDEAVFSPDTGRGLLLARREPT